MSEETQETPVQPIAEATAAPEPVTPAITAAATKPSTKDFFRRTRWWWIGGGILLLAGLGTWMTLAYLDHRDKAVVCTGSSCPGAVDEDDFTGTPAPSPTPPPVPNRLTGLPTTEALANLRPLAVVIENHPDARPQAGLGSADLVYEAIAEGGITRFLAVFSNPNQDIRVGPVRSARTFTVDMATELRAFYAHVGGNSDALEQIQRTSNFYDLDQFSVGAPTYQRDLSRPVATEHTMYSSTQKLWDFATTRRGWSAEAQYDGWKFEPDPAQADRPESHSVSINFSQPTYNVVWTYDKLTNTYSRQMAGRPHLDANSNAPILTDNIVLQNVAKRSVVSSGGKTVWHYTVTGTGKATIVRNGTAVEATWKKEGIGRTRYYGLDGQEIVFTEGKTWVEIIHTDIPFTLQ